MLKSQRKAQYIYVSELGLPVMVKPTSTTKCWWAQPMACFGWWRRKLTCIPKLASISYYRVNNATYVCVCWR